ncbi:PREDICTED: centromere protein F-like [Branchiostoma belcheri]|uniref:Centromere protein F-like n=1 Tax=Branchiostoma belcheri TaxID=7741 RepID=A0A6P4Z3M0_BRABE|nr:PREDICTED: centromere protein F-like [Branchiostoma belcheri]
MSWAAQEWKDGLPTRALQKVTEIEANLEKLKKEQKQRQFQMDSLEQTLQKTKRNLEEEKNKVTIMKRENQTLVESCEDLQKKREKIQHDLQTKESLVSCMEGQLSHAKASLDTETGRNHQLKGDLERVEQELAKAQHRAEKLHAENSQLQEASNHQRQELGGKIEKIKNLQHEIKKLQFELERGRSQEYTGSRRHGSGSSSDDESSQLKKKITDLESQRDRDAAEFNRVNTELKHLKQTLNEKQAASSAATPAKSNVAVSFDLVSFGSPAGPVSTPRTRSQTKNKIPSVPPLPHLPHRWITQS